MITILKFEPHELPLVTQYPNEYELPVPTFHTEQINILVQSLTKQMESYDVEYDIFICEHLQDTNPVRRGLIALVCEEVFEDELIAVVCIKTNKSYKFEKVKFSSKIEELDPKFQKPIDENESGEFGMGGDWWKGDER